MMFPPYGFPTLDQVIQRISYVTSPTVVLVLKREHAPPPPPPFWTPGAWVCTLVQDNVALVCHYDRRSISVIPAQGVPLYGTPSKLQGGEGMLAHLPDRL